MQNQYSTVEHNARRWIRYGKEFVGAISTTPIRSYVYPLYTPSGICVLQECPPDHAHHQGIMVGQDFVNGHNFWAMGHARYPLNFQRQENVQESIDDNGVTFVQKLRWATNDGQAILNEERHTRFESWTAEATRTVPMHFVEVTTSWHADFGNLLFGKTKEGGLGMRVHPGLETIWGGLIRSSKGTVGEKEVFDTQSEWIEVNGVIGGRFAGIVMMPHPSQPQIPWFVRDYGIHLHSPRRHSTLHVAAGDKTSMRVAFVAYDGKSDGSQADAAWQRYRAS